MILPAVTLTDPWASLCVAGIKTLETRKGPILSGFSGPLVIHRSRAAVDETDPLVRRSLELAGALEGRWGWEMRRRIRPDGWPAEDAGMALGVVYVKATRLHGRMVWIDERGWVPDGPPVGSDAYAALQRRACFPDLAGRYLSELTHAAWFPRPIPATGRLGRWKIDVPEEYLPGWATARSTSGQERGNRQVTSAPRAKS